ncbi:paraquat-inducible protein A [Dyella humi]|uniref:paraquat-inducible protein A n=1 Tax=Dyella humi TaxID=1770547 RepID=UPI003611B6BE
MYGRKRNSYARSAAYLIAALVLYIPANVYPVMYTKMLGDEADSTIIGGIMEFWESGSWDIALLIFLASVAVPCTKFITMGYLLWNRNVSEHVMVSKTRLLKFVEGIGYWSMLDVLVVAIVAALIQFQALGEAEPRLGIVFFGSVVVLTMLSALSFDGRLTWDRKVDHG